MTHKNAATYKIIHTKNSHTQKTLKSSKNIEIQIFDPE